MAAVTGSSIQPEATLDISQLEDVSNCEAYKASDHKSEEPELSPSQRGAPPRARCRPPRASGPPKERVHRLPLHCL